MSLDVTLTAVREVDVFEANITHNLNKMAIEAGVYTYLWNPTKCGIVHAAQLIAPLNAGVKRMKENPAYFKQFNAKNGWGTYENFVPWIEKYIQACEENPDAKVLVSR
jgi:hypothetical protein